MANETLTNIFSDIADAVRAKGVTGQMTPLQMPAKITSIPSGRGGDPRFDVDEQGNLTKHTFNINWFNDLESIGQNGLAGAYRETNVESVSFPNLKTIGQNGMDSVFISCSSLTQISFPELTTISGHHGMTNCFNGCTSLREASFPKLTTLTSDYNGYTMQQCFRGCTGLTSISFAMLSSVPKQLDLANLCLDCTNLISASFPELTTISGQYGMASCFDGCTQLKNVYLPKLSRSSAYACTDQMFNGCTSLELVDFHLATAVPAIESSAFNNTNNTFQIVVPDALYDTWITATNWSARSSQIVKYSEYTPAS